MSDLRKAIERMDSFTWAGCKDRPGPALRIVLGAARRFLALTETGPDYEAAARKYAEQTCDMWPCNECRDDVRPIVDVAFADYLTEEEDIGPPSQG